MSGNDRASGGPVRDPKPYQPDPGYIVSELDLDACLANAEIVSRTGYMPIMQRVTTKDVPALVAEVRRLRGQEKRVRGLAAELDTRIHYGGVHLEIAAEIRDALG